MYIIVPVIGKFNTIVYIIPVKLRDLEYMI